MKKISNFFEWLHQVWGISIKSILVYTWLILLIALYLISKIVAEDETEIHIDDNTPSTEKVDNDVTNNKKEDVDDKGEDKNYNMTKSKFIRPDEDKGFTERWFGWKSKNDDNYSDSQSISPATSTTQSPVTETNKDMSDDGSSTVTPTKFQSETFSSGNVTPSSENVFTPGTYKSLESEIRRNSIELSEIEKVKVLTEEDKIRRDILMEHRQYLLGQKLNHWDAQLEMAKRTKTHDVDSDKVHDEIVKLKNKVNDLHAKSKANDRRLYSIPEDKDETA